MDLPTALTADHRWHFEYVLSLCNDNNNNNNNSNNNIISGSRKVAQVKDEGLVWKRRKGIPGSDGSSEMRGGTGDFGPLGHHVETVFRVAYSTREEGKG